MRLFKKKSGLNPLDAPSRMNINTIVNDTAAKRNASMNPNRKLSKEQAPKKKRGFFKVFRRKSKLNGGESNEVETKTNIKLVSPPPSRENPMSKYFSMPTQGFECILNDDDLENVNVQRNTCQATISEHLPAVTTKACGEESFFYNWESFVSLLTATNKSLVTTIHDANDTLKSFLEDFDGEQGMDHQRSPTVVDGTGQQSKRQISTRDNTIKEVTFNLTHQSIPSDENDSQLELQSLNTNNSEADKTRGSTKSMEDDSSTSLYPNKTKGSFDNSVNAKDPNEVAKEGMALQQKVQKQQAEKRNMAVINNHNEEIETASAKPLVMPYEVPDLKAPSEEVFDSSFTLSFLKNISTTGVLLTYFKVPMEDEKVDEIPSNSVKLTIKPGLSRGARLLEPRLYWSDADGQNNEEYSVSLLGIHSINTSLNSEGDDQTQFFTITTNEGEVHVFEAATILERHNVVNGIRNVVAWLSYHLIFGNMASGTLVSNLDEQQSEHNGELPGLKTPAQAMNDLTHSFLD